MKPYRFQFLLICQFLFLGKMHAQFFGDVNGVGTATVDLCNCTVGDPVPNSGFGGSSLAVAPNGNTYSTIDLDV